MSNGPAQATADTAPVTGRPAPEPAPASRAGPEPAEDGAPAFVLRMGSVRLPISLEGDVRRGRLTVDLRGQRAGFAGVRLTEVRLRMRDGEPTGGSVHGEIDVPFVTGTAELDVDADGSLSGTVRGNVAVGLLGNPTVQLRYEAGQMAGMFEAAGSDLALPIPQVTVEEGRAHIRFTGASAQGTVSARFRHAALGRGRIEATLRDGEVSGSGGFELTVPILQGVEGAFDYADGKLAASAGLAAGDVETPVPGLSVPSLHGEVTVADGAVSGTFGVTAEYAGLARATLDGVTVGPRGFRGGRGALEITAPALAGSRGEFALTADGQVTGGLTLRSSQIPVPGVRRGSLTVRLREDGGVDVAGEGSIAFGPIGGGDFEVSYEGGVFTLGAGVRLQVPPLGEVTGALTYGEDGLAGSIQVPITVGPLSGHLLAVYGPGEGQEPAWSGEGRVDYRLPRFSGWVLVRMDPRGELSGEGEAEFQLADWLRGTIGLVVHPDLNVDARGELAFPDRDFQVFGGWELERNFFSFEQEFPLWGITIPVIGSVGIIAEIRASAGFRANFGPGTFGNIRAVGEVSTRPEAEPQFEISGDLVIPAGAEIVLTLGGGIGLSALVAKISGGVDLNGVAGVYGALTLSPTFAYRNGQYLLEGTALLEAAAQLRAGIDAYARIVVGKGWLSKTVWRENWRLAEWRFDPGWTASLRANVRQVLGEPFAPEVTFDRPEVDPVALVKRAVPRSGEPVTAPAREPEPRAEFQTTAGEAGAVDAAPGEGAGETPPAAEAPAVDGAGPAAEPPGAGGTGLEETTPEGEPHLPRIIPPRAMSIPAEDRTLQEAYLVYLYDSGAVPLLRRKSPTAPGDDELRERAEQAVAQGERGLPEQEASAGRPLSPDTRRRMEAIFAEDLDHVRVHTDPPAREAAADVGSEAFTVGRDVYFAEARSPEAGDEELLAHELVHVIQGPGDGAGETTEPTDDLEEEAEEAATAVKRGERPKPIRKRPGGADVRRAADDAGGDAGTVEFTEEEWRRVVSDPDAQAQETLRQILAQLIPKERFPDETMAKVYDERIDAFRESVVPMRWPSPDALPARGVFGDTQINVGTVLMRPGGEREADTPEQGAMAALIRARSRPVTDEGGAEPGYFTRSEIGRRRLPLPEEAWGHYHQTSYWRAAADAGDLATEFDERGQQTSQSVQNITLTRQAFMGVWGEGQWRYLPSNAERGGKWERIGPNAQGSPVEAGGGGDPAAADEEARVQLRNDFQAHHVVPLWMRSVQPRVPDGDVLRNLVPWHKDAHQTNHALQQRVPEPWRDQARMGGRTDYLDFPDGTRYEVTEMSGGTRQPLDPPNVRLVPRTESMTEPTTSYMWEPAPKPPWMP